MLWWDFSRVPLTTFWPNDPFMVLKSKSFENLFNLQNDIFENSRITFFNYVIIFLSLLLGNLCGEEDIHKTNQGKLFRASYFLK